MKLYAKVEKLLSADRKRKSKLFLFLDYDGTLAPIAKTPEKAVLPADTKSLLRKISQLPGVILAVISGRQLSDLEKMIRLSGLIYVGNHGLEMKSNRWRWIHPQAKQFRVVVKNVTAKLQRQIQPVEGAVLENKGFGLSLHYRLVCKKEIPVLYAMFNQTIKPWISRGKAKFSEGKKVWELRPSLDWNKGMAVRKLLEKYRCYNRDVVLCVGDDRTDEDAFRLLRREALTVRVGRRGKTNARYVLGNCQDVGKFLEKLLKLRNCE